MKIEFIGGPMDGKTTDKAGRFLHIKDDRGSVANYRMAFYEHPKKLGCRYKAWRFEGYESGN